ncbi:hypothetical protein H0H81_011818 [Sphagnurus paluster]|uniref:Uncharacterized protein n=1 Tax=Sphagnurus paluster TaxID=117069 RepID=A0A9P7FTY7_9AGAR|nr:hypothetical protein H0H81_011818 [Sphagnurus paluster]
MASGSTTATETPNTPQSEDAPRASFQSFASSGAQSSYSNPEPTTFSFPDPPNFSRPGSNRNSGNTNNNHNHSYAPYRESLIALPSPTGSFPGTPVAAGHSKHSSIASVSSMSMRPSASASAMSQPPLTASSIQYTLVEEREKEAANEKGDKRDKDKSPSEWSVEEVVEWLKLKGFDKDVCDKFIEQEITGDVLLELDVNLLKSEIGIMAFGKRMRIANAITDLRRPPSIVYSDHTDARPPQSPLTPHSPPMYHAHAHAHAHTRQPSQHSFPGAGAGASLSVPYAPSVQASSSVGSPMMYGSGLTSSYTESPATDYLGPPEGSAMGVSVSAPAMNGNGNGNGKAAKGRPAQLMLSPSDGALKESAKAVSDIIEQEDEERGIASEGEVVHTTSMRRRLFGRSHDSAGSKADSNSRHSKEGSLIASPVISEGREKGKDKEKEKEKEKEKDKERDKDKESMKSSRHARAKKSFDGGRGGDRLSIFGGTFSGSLGGKSRKPPPKYAGSNSTDGTHDEHGSDKSSLFTIPRLHSSGSRKVSSTQSTPNGTPKNGHKEPKVKDSPKPVMLSVREPRDPALLRKRTSSAPPPSDAKHATNTHVSAMVAAGLESPLKQGQSILAQIGEADHSGWMRKKGERYNSWKLRYFIIKGQHMYYLRSNSPSETKIKGYINIVGYKVTVDENVNPGRYGFRIEHDNDKTHYFSSDEKTIIRDWMKAIMKATIGRDYTKPVISSCNIPTIPLTVAQAMSPAPRPPSPTARDATQKALRRENPNQLSSRDARILMGLPSSNDNKEDRTRLESFFDGDTLPSPVEDLGESPVIVSRSPAVPSRPSREMRRQSITRASISVTPEDTALIEWANSHLPLSLQIKDPTGSVCGGLSLLRIAESVKGRPMSPSVPDSAFPQSPTDDKLDGLFQLFDFLLDNDVKMGSVSINDVRQGKRDKILQLLRALKAWEDKRRAIHNSIGSASSVQAGGFMAPSTVAMVW